MSTKFQTGDRVYLNDWRWDPKIGHLWSTRDALVVGLLATITNRHSSSFMDVMIDDKAFTAWPEAYLRLEEEPSTLPSIKAAVPANAKPQWQVSRDASLEPGNCPCGCPRARCSYHSTPADTVAESFGAGFAAAHAAGWKP